MSMPLNAEQSDALTQLAAYVAAGDFLNAYAALELFPQSDPYGPAAPFGINLGEIFLSRLAGAQGIAAAPDPQVAVPALRALIGVIAPPHRAVEFIAYCQTRLLAEAPEPLPPPASAAP